MALLAAAGQAWGEPGVARAARPHMLIEPVEREPSVRARPTPAQIAELRRAVGQNPKSRKARFDLVRGLMTAGELDEAEQAAEGFRAHDAYNLVAVRLLGDIQRERGETEAARRTYSAIVELLPKDVEARRALATVLKQGGDVEGARAQLNAALELRPSDHRTAFELGDVEQLLGDTEAARQRFEAIARASDASDSLRYPARQRLGQIYGRKRVEALTAHDQKRALEWLDAIERLSLSGGLENDLKVFLAWDTDRSDVDLWVTTPSGEKIFYGARRGSHGEALFDDVTTGYGPESFTAHHAEPGDYVVQVNFYGSRSGAFKQARGEVTIIVDEGRQGEVRKVLPYRLYEEKDTVTVAKVHVSGSAGT